MFFQAQRELQQLSIENFRNRPCFVSIYLDGEGGRDGLIVNRRLFKERERRVKSHDLQKLDRNESFLQKLIP